MFGCDAPNCTTTTSSELTLTLSEGNDNLSRTNGKESDEAFFEWVIYCGIQHSPADHSQILGNCRYQGLPAP
jgi:hypothetical protein